MAFDTNDAKLVVLTLSPAVAYGESGITVDYTEPTDATANPLEDAAGNKVATFSGQAVTNATAAPTAPCAASSSSSIGPDDLTLEATATTIKVTESSISTNHRFELCKEGSATITSTGFISGNMHTFADLDPDTQYWVRLDGACCTPSAWKPIRTLAPPPASVSLTVGAAGDDGTWHNGEAIEVTATFAASVTVTGTPRIAFTLGAAEKHLTYASGGPGTALVFSYTVASGDTDTDGIEIAADALENHSGSTIKLTSDGATDAALDHAAVAASTSHTVDGGRGVAVGAGVHQISRTATTRRSGPR